MKETHHLGEATRPDALVYQTPESIVAQRRLRRAAIGGLLVFLTCALGFAFGLMSGVRDTDVYMLLLALITFGIGCAPLVMDQARDPMKRHVMLALVSLVFMAHFVVPALMLYLPATGPIDASSTAFTNLLPSHVVDGQVMALVGLVSLQVGYMLPLGRIALRNMGPPRGDWSPGTCLGVALSFLAAGWSITLMGVLGLIPPAVGTGVIGVFATGRNYANVLLAYAYIRYRSYTAALLIGLNVTALLIFGLLTSDKMDALIGPAIVVLTSMLLTKRIRARWILLGFLAVVTIYPASVFVRKELLPYTTVTQLVTNPGNTLSLISGFVGTGEFSEHLQLGYEATAHRIDGLGIASVIIRDTPGVSPFQYGRTLGLFFVSFVPRIFWREKPDINIGQWITDVYGSGPHIQSHTAPTPIGEFYLNFGVPGVLFGLMLLGVVLRLAHEGLSRRGATAPSILAQSVILVIFGLQFAGSVAGVYGQVVFTLVPILMLRLVIGTFTRLVPLSSGPSDGSPRPSPAAGVGALS